MDATRASGAGARWWVALAVGCVVGALVTWVVVRDDDRGDERATATSSTAAATTAATSSSGASTEPEGAADPSLQRVAEAIGPMPLPTDCPLELDDPDLLPNAPRDYRGGVHEGVDFICGEPGHEAITPLAGRVMVAARDLPEPEPDERVQILEDAKALGDTPPWTLQLLYGQFVVIDHGVIEGAGHVVTLYAHLAEIDPALRPGVEVAAGARVGQVGDTGTEAAGTGEDAPYSYHLHWEVQVDDAFLGRGATPDEVRVAYRSLFEG